MWYTICLLMTRVVGMVIFEQYVEPLLKDHLFECLKWKVFVPEGWNKHGFLCTESEKQGNLCVLGRNFTVLKKRFQCIITMSFLNCFCKLTSPICCSYLLHSGFVYGAKEAKKLQLFIDDLNLPVPDEHNVQRINEVRTAKIGKHIEANTKWLPFCWGHIDGLVQDCRNSSLLAMELLQSCTKPLI